MSTLCDRLRNLARGECGLSDEDLLQAADIIDRLPIDADGNPMSLGDTRVSHGSPCIVRAIAAGWITVEQWGGHITRLPAELYGSVESERAAKARQR